MTAIWHQTARHAGGGGDAVRTVLRILVSNREINTSESSHYSSLLIKQKLFDLIIAHFLYI